jgi:hypothetical protein
VKTILRRFRRLLCRALAAATTRRSGAVFERRLLAKKSPARKLVGIKFRKANQ